MGELLWKKEEQQRVPLQLGHYIASRQLKGKRSRLVGIRKPRRPQMRTGGAGTEKRPYRGGG
jgi:hypothetical protein